MKPALSALTSFVGPFRSADGVDSVVPTRVVAHPRRSQDADPSVIKMEGVMTADDKRATVWTVGILLAIVVAIAAAGYWLGWFDLAPTQVPAKG